MLAGAMPAGAETPRAAGLTLNTYGMPGLLDMPVAIPLPDAELATTLSVFDGSARGTLTFQIAPRLTGAFRYSIIEGFDLDGGTRYDRSFDLQYQLVTEQGWRPGVAVGLRDFAGTGVFSGEYFVATKHVTPRLAFSGGIGWGRLGSFGSFDNPIGPSTRAGRDDLGGEPNFDQWFTGPAAFFGGLAWQATDKLAVQLEYSSDAYTTEVGRGLVDRSSPINLGLSYAVRPGTVLRAQYLHGSELGLSASFTLNPKRPALGGDRSPAPLPVAVRPGSADSWAGAIITDPAGQAALQDGLARALALDGIELRRMDLQGDTVRLQIDNTKFDSAPQAIGRTARILTALMPAGVERFEIVPMVQGVPAAQVTLLRSDMERLEFAPDNTAASLAAAQIGPAGPLPGPTLPGQRFTWGLGPYVAAAVFDPDEPLRVDAGLELSAAYAVTPQLSFSGAVRAKVLGNRDQSTRVSTSVLQHVRSDANLYDRDGEFGIEYLTVDYFGRPGPNLYSRVSAGYLEEMFGGVSAELLWKPVDSRLALGAEVNYVMQRDTDKLFGFGDFDYSVLTGHASAYYDFDNGFAAQVDVGRYLAGDYGATFTLDRTFDNGWKIGAFFTLTDVPFSDFGEGSFDKGIRITLPQSWFTGQPTKARASTVIRPVQRDGGARLEIRNRLYEQVRDYHAPELGDQWGRFWR